MKVGDHATARRAFTAQDVDAFIGLGGAAPPAGLVPEPLLGALFSYLLGVKLPGFGANYLKQETDYLHPAPLRELLEARVEITRIRPDKNLVDLETTLRGGNAQLLCRGRALIHVRDVAGRS